MKTTSYLITVIITGFFSSMALVGFRNNEVHHLEERAEKLLDTNDCFSDCRKMIDTIKKNNEISEKNLKFVKSKLQEIN